MTGKETDKVIEVRNLKTHFNTRGGLGRAVDGVSFDIEEGGTLAIVGESGCGKSVTALSLIQLVPTPGGFIDSGEILLRGRDILPLSEGEKRRIRGSEISMIFQEPMTSLNPVFTIGEQISEVLLLHETKDKEEARRITIEMLGKVGLPEPENLMKKYPHTLSGGQRQRVMIAMALACKPSLLIADEPTTALDVTIQEQILSLMGELQRELGTALLLITHNLGLVYKNAEEVGVMYGGKIVERSSTKRLFRRPLHPYTVKLMHAVPGMEKRGEALDTIKGTVPPATDFPLGCRFSGRCPKEMTGCGEIEPLLKEVEKGHLTTCHLYDDAFTSSEEGKPLYEVEGGEREITVPPPSSSLQETGEAGGAGETGGGATESILTVRDLKVHYPVRGGIFKKVRSYLKAVDGIDLDIDGGTTTALVGESGCGKTTTGRALVRLIDRSTARISGTCRFKGKDLLTLPESELKRVRSEVQIIFQDPYSSLNPRMVVGEIIDEGLKTLKPHLTKGEREESIGRVLERVGMRREMANRYPHEFSGGQRQRIGIARALVVEPELIICDEAVSALDVSVQAQILNLLKSIQVEFGITLLFITHDLGVVEYIADKVAVMKEGRIVECGSVEDIFKSPREEYTKTLLEAVPRIGG